MIPMLCPSCGRRGNVPPDKLNSTLHCKKCNTVFYLDLSGKVILGEPPSAKKKAAQSSEQTGEFDVIGAIARFIVGLPMAVKALVVLVIVGGVAFAVFNSASNAIRLTPGTAESLQHKTVDVGEAYVSQDFSTLEGLAAPGTEAALKSWYDMTRPRIGDYGKQEQGLDVTVSPNMSETPTGDDAKTSAILVFPMKPGETKMEDVTTVKFAWRKDKGDWTLDGNAMLEEAKADDANSKSGGAAKTGAKK